MPERRAYHIEVSPAADRDLQKLKHQIRLEDLQRLRTTIDTLATEPRPHSIRKIKGGEVAYRIKVGSYRVVYEVHDAHRLVLILQVTRRSETTYRE